MKEIIEKNKAYIILILVLAIYLLITYALLKKDANKKKDIAYLVTNNSKYIYEDKEFKQPDNITELNWKDYNVYVDNTLLGKYKLQYNNKWYIYNEQRDSIKYEGKVIASSNLDIEVINYDLENITEMEVNRINSYLEKENINIVDYNIYDSKIEYDIDNDGKKEKIYRVNSRINNNNDNIFSIILIEKDNGFTKVKSKVVTNQSNDNIMIYDIYGLIDIDGDKKLEIIVSEMQYSQPDKSNEQIYTLKNNKYEKISE